jgi:BirA family biotin operon repressor/biotin-[acetyl-CoA-carboxylase] ligase
MTYDGLPERALGQLVSAPLVVAHDSLPSTLDLAHELAAQGAPEGTLVLADEQTAGRGRQGRAWHSPRGAGLWMALVMRPRRPPSAGALAVRAGLAVVDAVAEAAPGLTPRLKWPNDLVVAGRKAGGVLCEARWTGDELAWVAVGVGINVRGPVPQELADSAVALSDVAPGVGRLLVLTALVPRLLATSSRPSVLDPAERARFHAVAAPLPATEGLLEDLEPDGALLLRRPDGSLDRRAAPT